MSKVWYYIFWYSILILLYVGVCAGVAGFSANIDMFEIEFDPLRYINYSQGTNTFYIQPIKILFHIFTILYGFVWVNKLILKSDKYISGKKDHYYDTKLILVVQMIFFIFTGNINIRGRFDKKEFWNNKFFFSEDFVIVNFEDDCHEHKFLSIFIWNLCCIGVPQFIGCHWTYMMCGPFKQISLSPTRCKTFKWQQWLIVIAICIIVVVDLSIIILVYVFNSKWPLYLLYLIVVGIILLVRHLKLRKTMNLHIHHWMLFTFLTTLIGWQTPIMTVQFGLFTGCMCEGATKYGCTPMYYLKPVLPPNQSIEKTLEPANHAQLASMSNDD